MRGYHSASFALNVRQMMLCHQGHRTAASRSPRSPGHSPTKRIRAVGAPALTVAQLDELAAAQQLHAGDTDSAHGEGMMQAAKVACQAAPVTAVVIAHLRRSRQHCCVLCYL